MLDKCDNNGAVEQSDYMNYEAWKRKGITFEHENEVDMYELESDVLSMRLRCASQRGMLSTWSTSMSHWYKEGDERQRDKVITTSL